MESNKRATMCKSHAAINTGAYIRPAKAQVIIKSIGSKYITVEGHPSHSRFSICTHESVDDKTGWNPRLNLYESEAEYDKQQALRLRKNKLQYEIENLIQTASIEKLESIYILLKS